MMEMLLDYGANIEGGGASRSPLFKQVVEKEHNCSKRPCTELLLRRGASMDAVDDEGRGWSERVVRPTKMSTLFLTCEEKRKNIQQEKEELFLTLISLMHFRKNTALRPLNLTTNIDFDASLKKAAKLMRNKIEFNQEVHRTMQRCTLHSFDSDGKTVLHHAAKIEDFQMMYLLDHYNKRLALLKDHDSKTPLDYAEESLSEAVQQMGWWMQTHRSRGSLELFVLKYLAQNGFDIVQK